MCTVCRDSSWRSSILKAARGRDQWAAWSQLGQLDRQAALLPPEREPLGPPAGDPAGTRQLCNLLGCIGKSTQLARSRRQRAVGKHNCSRQTRPTLSGRRGGSLSISANRSVAGASRVCPLPAEGKINHCAPRREKAINWLARPREAPASCQSGGRRDSLRPSNAEAGLRRQEIVSKRGPGGRMAEENWWQFGRARKLDTFARC